MRLKQKEIDIIKSNIFNIFGENEIYLFGSRLNNDKKGGDIDLFVISKEKTNSFEKKIKAIAKLKRLLNKPIDIVVHKNFDRLIEQEALNGKKL